MPGHSQGHYPEHSQGHYPGHYPEHYSQHYPEHSQEHYPEHYLEHSQGHSPNTIGYTIRNTLRDIIRNTIRNTLRDTLCLTETLHPAHTFISGESLTMKGIVMLILLSTCYMFFTGSQLINVSMLCTVLGWSHEAFFATLKSTHC